MACENCDMAQKWESQKKEKKKIININFYDSNVLCLETVHKWSVIGRTFYLLENVAVIESRKMVI